MGTPPGEVHRTGPGERGRLRVAVLLGAFPVVSETFIARQVNALIELGHHVTVYAQFAPPSGIVHPEVTRNGLLDKVVYLQVPGGRASPPARSLAALRRLPALSRALTLAPRATLRALNPAIYGYSDQPISSPLRRAAFILDVVSHQRAFDVVHAHFGPVANAYRFARGVLGVPMVVTFHGYDLVKWPAEHGRDGYRKLFAEAALITGGTEYALGKLGALGCPANKLRKLPASIAVEQFPYAERPHRADSPLALLSVGRLISLKGLEYAIRAVASVRQQGCPVHYDIIGDGPLRGELEALIDELDIRESVVLHGAQSSDFVRQKMAAAHVFLMSSVTVDGVAEGQGLVVQEAQASGLAVVATDSGGIREGLLPDQTGYLVPERDPRAMAGAILRLAHNEANRLQMGHRGRRFVEEYYDGLGVTARLVDVYRDAAGTSQYP